MSDKTKVFVSYARADEDQLAPLLNALEDVAALQVLRDTQDILPSEEWKPRLEEMIRSADVILYALSPRSAASDVCNWEIVVSRELSKRVVPVVLADVAPENVPEDVAALNYIFFKENADLDDAVAQITTAVETNISWIREHTRLTELATRWERAQRIAAQPLRGNELQAAEEWMSRQPRTAPPPTDLQRNYIFESRRLATRRQRIITGVSMVSAVVLVGLSSVAWVQRNAAIAAEARAQAALKSATRAANTMMLDLAHELNTSLVPKSTVASVLGKADALRSELGETFGEDRELAALKSTASLALGDIYSNLGRTLEAQKLVAQSLEIRRSRLADKPEDIQRMSSLASALRIQALILIQLEQEDQAQDVLTEALELRQTILERAPDRHVNLSRMSTIYGQLAGLAYRREDYKTSKALRLNAIGRLESYLAANPEAQVDTGIASQKYSLSILTREQGDLNASFTLIQEAEAYARSGIEKDPTRIGRLKILATVLSEKSDVLGYLGQSVASAQAIEETMRIRADLVALDPQNPDIQSEYATALRDVAGIRRTEGQLTQARDLISQAIDISSNLLRIDPADVSALGGLLTFNNDLIDVLLGLGELNGAKSRLQDAKRILDQMPDNTSKLVQDRTLWGFHSSALDIAFYDNDGTAMLASIAMMAQTEERGLAREPNSTWWMHARAARLSRKSNAHSLLKEYEAANDASDNAIKQYNQLAEIEPESIVWPLNRMSEMVSQAWVQRQIPDIDPVEIDALYLEAFTLAFELNKRDPDRISPMTQMTLIAFNRGDLYRDYQLYGQAYEYYDSALAGARLRDEKFPDYHQSEADRAEILGRLALSAAEQAEQLLKKGDLAGTELWAKRALEHGPETIGYRAELAHARMLQGDQQGALKLYQSVQGPMGFGTISWHEYLTLHLTQLREFGYSDGELAALIQYLETAE